MSALRAGKDAWRRYDLVDTMPKLMDSYAERWAFYEGTLFNDAWRNSPLRSSMPVYRNISLMLKHAEAVVDFHAATVYQGDLSTDGKPLPNGTYGAIPIDPQVEDKAQQQLIRTAFAELTTAWNWKQNMTLRPMYGAALGDVLTELIDDVEHGFVYPQVVWPGYVKEIELDYVSNVKYYAVEYWVEEENERGESERYLYRREVDGEEYRYFKNGVPFDFYGNGAVEPNPYHFVPAVWDRHRITWGERGASALSGTQQAVMQVNSLLSQSFDFQRKAFFAPIMVKGLARRRSQESVQLAKPPRRERAGEEDDVAEGLAESIGIVPVTGDNPTLLQPTFDLGQTLAVLQLILDNIKDENPEARFYSELRSMSTLTGPGAERALGDAVSRCNRARAGYDVQTVKLFQMAMTMCGLRSNDGSWGPRLSRRQQAFKEFSLDSYRAGDMDFGIMERPVILPTEQERVELILSKEQIKTGWGREQAGFDEETIIAMEAEEQLRAQSFEAQIGRGAF